MNWVKNEVDPNLVRGIARRHGIDLLTASILARRGVVEPRQILYFLEDDPRFLHNPFHFEQMEDAVDRILLARDEGEKVLVFGDGDTDGVTSTVLLTETLRDIGMEPSWRIPRGDEPYGLSAEAVRTFAESGGTLIVTVDCGISNHAEVELAAELGVDVIIADHHRLQSGSPPPALAVLDPKLTDSGYPFRDLAGVGVAYKLACALRFALSGLYKQPIALLNLRPVAAADAPSGSAVPAAAPVEMEAAEASVRGTSGRAGTGAGAVATGVAAPGTPVTGAPGTGPAARETYVIEAIRLYNLRETGRLSETVSPGSFSLGSSKLAAFLSDRQIFVWNGGLQSRYMAAVVGKLADVHFYDVAGDIAKAIPQAGGKSLAELQGQSRVARYEDGETGELEVFRNLFTSFAMIKAGLSGGRDTEALQLVALGTLADLMPLRDENRILVKRGLAAFNAAPRQGARELLSRLGTSGRALSSNEIAWQVTPLVNSAGRMGKPELAFRLFASADGDARAAAAEEIQQTNLERRRLGGEAWEAVLPLARDSLARQNERFALVGSDNVRPGITGLIASRVSATLRVPSVIAAFQPNGNVVGSVRTARGFPVSGLLAACADLFTDYGGHDAAAGFSMPLANWEEFSRRAADYMARADLAAAEERILVDAELPHEYLRPELKDLFDTFEPFGEENRPLVLMSRGVSMMDAQIVGKSGKNHLKLTLDFGAYKWPALLWDGAERLERDFSFRDRDRVDVLFKVTVNRWNGEERPQLELYDIRRAAGPAAKASGS